LFPTQAAVFRRNNAGPFTRNKIGVLIAGSDKSFLLSHDGVDFF
jgi:hypothetical protein